MSIFAALALLCAAGASSWFGVGLMRRYALQRLIDVPNERSSHVRPTPRGGGIAIAVVHFLGVLFTVGLGLTPMALTLALASGLVVALVGFQDDHGHVSAKWRLACHVAAVAWAVSWLGALPPVDIGFMTLDLGWLGTLLLVLFLAWFINLFNFMDGIDGIAAMQAVIMSTTAAVLAFVSGSGSHAALPGLILASATAGFLIWNWPPARIFMGDGGSGYLGFALGVLGLWTVIEGWLSPWVWLILGGAFIADATVTLLVRAHAGASLAEAHRSHAYQRLSRHWGGHRPVTLAFCAVNLLWLLPWAWVATRWPSSGAACAVVALAPLFLAAKRLGAGRSGEIGGRC